MAASIAKNAIDVALLKVEDDAFLLRGFHVAHPQIAKILLLQKLTRDPVINAFRFGARGVFEVSDSSLHMLCKAIVRVHQGDTSVPDPDTQASWVARYYLIGWSSGFAQMYWYAYDSPTYGTLWTSDGGVTLAGQAYGTTYNWVAGSALTSGCSNAGTVWTCGLTLANGSAAEVNWDTSETCSGGVCTFSSQNVSDAWTEYQDLTGTSYSIATPGLVPVGVKPILLSSG